MSIFGHFGEGKTAVERDWGSGVEVERKRIPSNPYAALHPSRLQRQEPLWPPTDQSAAAFWAKVEADKPSVWEFVFDKLLLGGVNTDTPPTFDESQGYVEIPPTQDGPTNW